MDHDKNHASISAIVLVLLLVASAVPAQQDVEEAVQFEAHMMLVQLGKLTGDLAWLFLPTSVEDPEISPPAEMLETMDRVFYMLRAVVSQYSQWRQNIARLLPREE